MSILFLKMTFGDYLWNKAREHHMFDTSYIKSEIHNDTMQIVQYYIVA